MRVTRLEIFGFKSFMDRIVLPLEGGVTGVVGPNGCGKSNVVDSIRWVLGETRASSLRGDVLEDIIFNGTESLRPLGLAEVTLTLRASGADLFADLVQSFQTLEIFEPEPQAAAVEDSDIVEVSEKPHGSDGETAPSDEQVVGTEEPVVREKPVLTVIQGNLGNPVAEVRAPEAGADSILEEPVSEDIPGKDEAASFSVRGVVETDAVEKKARPAAEPAPFLSRFSWLETVQEVQVTRRIYRSGESEFFINRTPCRLKDLKEFFRVVGLSARAHTIVAQGEVSRIITAKPEERRLILEDAAGVLGFRDKIAAASRRLEETRVNISRIDDILKEVTKQVASLKRQAAKASSRKELKDRVAELEHLLFADESKVALSQAERITSELQNARRQGADVDAELQKLQAEEQLVRGELMGIDLESDDLRRKIDSLKEEINNRARQRSELVSRANELKAYVVSRTAEIGRLTERQSTLSQRLESSAQDVEQLTAREAELLAQLESLEVNSQGDLQQATKELEELRDGLRSKDDQISKTRERLVRSESMIRAIEDQLITSSPREQIKRTLGADRESLLQGELQGTMLLADGLQVPAKYERAVQAVLAERAGYLVTEDPYFLGRQFRERMVRADKKSQQSFGLGVLRRGQRADATAPVADGAALPSLLGCISVREECGLVAHRLLNDVLVAENLEEAFDYFDRIRASGESSLLRVVTLDGEIISDHSVASFRSEGGLIPLKNRVSELSAEREQVNEQLVVLAEERRALEQGVKSAAERRDTVLSEIAQRQKTARELSNQLGSTRGRLQSERRVADQVKQDGDRIAMQLRDCERAIEEYSAEELKVLKRMEDLIPQAETDLRAELAQLVEQTGRIDKIRSEGRTKLSSVAKNLDDVRRKVDQLRSAVSHGELEEQKMTLEVQHRHERFMLEYGEEVLQMVLASVESFTELSTEDRTEFRQEAQGIRSRILREGEVDPTSIERYQEENQRLEDLSGQRADLEEAAATIQKTINRLTETSRLLFMRTFEGVRKNFSQLIPRLFGGGKGDLQLTNPDSPLDSGIDIIAKPPGKKLKSIELLSGGEKALCATALVFSMFLERPSPLCVLDEVDAPLDEANLVRFISLVKEMSTRTQFIMITHNKSSMAASDNLVGVTMQEPGASKIITVSLQDAVRHVA